MARMTDIDMRLVSHDASKRLLPAAAVEIGSAPTGNATGTKTLIVMYDWTRGEDF